MTLILHRQSIYSEASEVLIGLDDSRPYSIMDVPAQHAMAAATLQGLAGGSHLWQLEYFLQQSSSNGASPREATSSFGQILDSRWFGRTWVVQETCLAKSAIILFPWGDFDWNVFHDAFFSWNQHSRTCCKAFAKSMSVALGDACNRMYLHVRCIAYTRAGLAGQDQHIIEPMLNYQHLEVSDRRDKIYAFRGLHTDQTLPLPIPDYQSMERTFVEFVLWYLEDKQSLLILGLDMCFGKVQDMDLPSWVPTWPTFTAEQGIERGNTAKARGKFLQCYAAAPELEMAYEWDIACPEILRLNGIVLDDMIIAVSEKSFTDKMTFLERVELMKAWYRFAYPDHFVGHHSFQHMHGTFFETILAGIVNEPGRSGPRLLGDDAAVIKELRRTLIGMEQDGPWYTCSPFQTMIIQSQDVALLDRKIFRTQHGRTGVGLCTMESGDEVFLLGGGNAPFILRAADGQKKGSYQLIGHCYIHGIMNGELQTELGGRWVDLT